MNKMFPDVVPYVEYLKRVSNSLLTVITTCYNNEKFIKSALMSGIRQSIPFQWMIVDDGSSDNSLSVIEKTLVDNDVKNVQLIIENVNKGQAIRYNEAIQRAKTPYIAYLDSDDISRSRRLARQLEFLEHNKDIWCVGTHAFTTNETAQWEQPGDEVIVTGNYVYPPKKHDNIVKHIIEQRYSPMLHPTVMFRKEGFLGYDLTKPNPNLCDDLDMYCRSIKKGLKFANIQEPLIVYRIHPNSLSQRFPELIFREAQRICDQYYPAYR